MSLLDRGLVYELAWQRIRQLLPPTVADKCRMKDTASSSVTTFAPREYETIFQQLCAIRFTDAVSGTCSLYIVVIVEPGQNIRCVLTYQSGNKASIPVSGAAMHIGIGSFLCFCFMLLFVLFFLSTFYRRSVAFCSVSVELVVSAFVRFCFNCRLFCSIGFT
jgi:hypothetical protein